jgi:hypothetical protein
MPNGKVAAASRRWENGSTVLSPSCSRPGIADEGVSAPRPIRWQSRLGSVPTGTSALPGYDVPTTDCEKLVALGEDAYTPMLSTIHANKSCQSVCSQEPGGGLMAN